MTSNSALIAGQALAESEMEDTFEVFAPTGSRVVVAGMEVPGYTSMGNTKGKIQSRSRRLGDTQTRYLRIGAVERPVLEGALHIPVATPIPTPGGFGIGWEYECTEVGPVTDPALLGRRFLVVEVPIKSRATARRLDVAEL